MEDLPRNVSIQYSGEVHPSKVLDELSSYDLFALSSRRENYGYAVLVFLTAGTPLLITDKTPWLPSADDAVQDMSLAIHEAWSSPLDQVARLWYDEDVSCVIVPYVMPSISLIDLLSFNKIAFCSRHAPVSTFSSSFC